MCWIPCCSPWSRAFPPPPPLLASPPALCGGFAGTMPMFDSSPVCWSGLRLWLPGPVRGPIAHGCQRGLSVLARAVSRRAYGSWTTPGLAKTCDVASASMAFPLQALGRRPELVFRSSIPRPSMPLSTLHPAPRGTQRKTRGQDGSLLLSRGALSSPAARRFIPTIALHYCRGSDSQPRIPSRACKQAVLQPLRAGGSACPTYACLSFSRCSRNTALRLSLILLPSSPSTLTRI